MLSLHLTAVIVLLGAQQPVTRAEAVAAALARGARVAMGRADTVTARSAVRGARIGAAESARDAARFGFAFERAAIRFDVETTYTNALAGARLADLSRRTA